MRGWKRRHGSGRVLARGEDELRAGAARGSSRGFGSRRDERRAGRLARARPRGSARGEDELRAARLGSGSSYGFGSRRDELRTRRLCSGSSPGSARGEDELRAGAAWPCLTRGSLPTRARRRWRVACLERQGRRRLRAGGSPPRYAGQAAGEPDTAARWVCAGVIGRRRPLGGRTRRVRGDRARRVNPGTEGLGSRGGAWRLVGWVSRRRPLRRSRCGRPWAGGRPLRSSGPGGPPRSARHRWR